MDGVNMSLPHRHQVDFAKREGSVPYPCFYCMNKLPTIEYKTDEHNIVKEFGMDEGDVPQICMAGIHKPTDYADCKRALIVELSDNVHRSFPSEYFTFFTREYMMEMITDIRAMEYAPKSKLIGRGRKGYHTREQRLKELYDAGYVDQSYDINNEETYNLTAQGNDIADALSDFLSTVLYHSIRGDLFEDEVVVKVFEFIRSHSGCTKKQIYDYFDSNYGYEETVVPIVVQTLEDAGYIEPIFSADFEQIEYNTTQKGVLRWQRNCQDH